MTDTRSDERDKQIADLSEALDAVIEERDAAYKELDTLRADRDAWIQLGHVKERSRCVEELEAVAATPPQSYNPDYVRGVRDSIDAVRGSA